MPDEEHMVDGKCTIHLNNNLYYCLECLQAEKKLEVNEIFYLKKQLSVHESYIIIIERLTEDRE